MHESSSSQFFRTTTGIQWETDTFDEWKFVINFLTILGATESFCFTSICKFGSLKNTFTTIDSPSELYFRFRRFICSVQTKKGISMNYDISTSSWKTWTWMSLYLIHTMMDIYINSSLNLLTKFTSSSRSTYFKKILQ